MTEAEELIYSLGKDLAVMAETQRSCQKSQAQTTENINSLTASVDKLAREAVRLEGIFANIATVDGRVDKLEQILSKRLDKIETAYVTWSRTVIGAIFVAIVGVIFKVVGA